MRNTLCWLWLSTVSSAQASEACEVSSLLQRTPPGTPAGLLQRELPSVASITFAPGTEWMMGWTPKKSPTLGFAKTAEADEVHAAARASQASRAASAIQEADTLLSQGVPQQILSMERKEASQDAPIVKALPSEQAAESSTASEATQNKTHEQGEQPEQFTQTGTELDEEPNEANASTNDSSEQAPETEETETKTKEPSSKEGGLENLENTEASTSTSAPSAPSLPEAASTSPDAQAAQTASSATEPNLTTEVPVQPVQNATASTATASDANDAIIDIVIPQKSGNLILEVKNPQEIEAISKPDPSIPEVAILGENGLAVDAIPLAGDVSIYRRGKQREKRTLQLQRLDQLAEDLTRQLLGMVEMTQNLSKQGGNASVANQSVEDFAIKAQQVAALLRSAEKAYEESLNHSEVASRNLESAGSEAQKQLLEAMQAAALGLNLTASLGTKVDLPGLVELFGNGTVEASRQDIVPMFQNVNATTSQSIHLPYDRLFAPATATTTMAAPEAPSSVSNTLEAASAAASAVNLSVETEESNWMPKAVLFSMACVLSLLVAVLYWPCAT